MSERNTHPNTDNILQLLTETANTKDYTVDITLNVKGSVVTGTVVSAMTYLEEIAGEFSEENDIEQTIYEKLMEAASNLKDEEAPETNYVHLKDAKLFSESGKSLPSNGSVLWRGKLSDIDGFFLGKITTEE
ncbi:gas vesicle protein GvpU [Salipaludibacillus neizhouensis]|uniref:Gas vesicle protein GvpU n=1 Tax=Salipaludibacillus neizhouensis TaxID=885475 RepID=A0A3A9K4N0_9BACI|nr:gas vesicle accessory protein GvpU [Salipaludibacillus neizhouensis]RKL66288.1 gas vesicle protein GvpU [Salipaludibacillus neizhouensis]